MYCLSEMSHVVVSLESDEVGAEHAAEEMLSGCKASELEESVKKGEIASGDRLTISEDGNVTWRKNPIVASGIFSRIR
jgi:hypothetical protein